MTSSSTAALKGPDRGWFEEVWLGPRSSGLIDEHRMRCRALPGACPHHAHFSCASLLIFASVRHTVLGSQPNPAPTRANDQPLS